MKSSITAILLLCVILLSGGCVGDTAYTPPTASSSPREAGESRAEETFTEAFIQDRQGKVWDVTQAQKYGLVPSGFQFGLGPYAIRPIMNPQMLSPGDYGYPSDYEGFLILGASLNGFARAYPIAVLSRHEVANEQFGDAHVAVAY